MKRVILCDMDQVIAHTDDLKMMNDFMGTSFTVEDAKTVTLVEELLPNMDDRYRLIDHIVDINFYLHSEIAPGTKEVMKSLHENEDFYVCTSAYFKYGINREADLLKIKSEFLIKEFDFLPPDHHIYITHKSLLNADVRIDDNIHNLLSNTATKLLYTTYANEDLSSDFLRENNITRVDNWYDIERIILG